MDLKIQCHELGIGLFVKIQLGIAPCLVLFLYKTEQYQVVGFIKPTIVGSKSSKSPALTLIRVELEENLQLLFKTILHHDALS